MECTVEQSDDTKTLTLKGDLTIIHAVELKKVLQEAIDNSRHVELNIENVTGLDLSCLQLFCSAHRTSLNLDRSLSIAGDLPEAFSEAVKDAGFSIAQVCELDSGDSCLWTERT